MDKYKKIELGIEIANCETCGCLGSDGDGWEYNGSWPVCEKIEKYSYLKSFPFKKEMPCWEANFWHTKFADHIKKGTDAEISAALDLFCLAIEPICYG